MSSKLENLPLELFGALSEFLLANEVCWLWLTGSKRIRHLLEQGTTSFRHLPAQRRTYLWPAFISRFKRLLTASFTSTREWNTSELYSGVVLADIPNSITSLKLDFPNGFLSLLRPPSIDMVSPPMQILAMPLATLFPDLAHLEVFSVAGAYYIPILSWDPILLLPLSSLHLSLPMPFSADLLEHLSPTITSLKISPMGGNVNSFPPHLVALTLEFFGGSLDTSVLPMTLRRFSVNCLPNGVVQCSNWPSKLKFLSITNYILRLNPANVTSFPNTLLSLSLVIGSMDLASLHDLPQKLTFLSIYCSRAFSALSKQEWDQFEPNRLPPGLLDAHIEHIFLQTPIERWNTFPIGMRPARTTNISSLNDIIPYASGIADRIGDISWYCSEPEMNWSFKNLKALSFGDSVHAGQLYLTIPLLPFLKQLIIRPYIEDPSLALNRIVSPFFSRLFVNCHPLSLCKWDKRWLQHIELLNLRYSRKSVPNSSWSTLLASTGSQLDESSRNAILAMDNADWNDWRQFGGIRTEKGRTEVPFINWHLYAPLLPLSLTELDFQACGPMAGTYSSISTSEIVWPPRLSRMTAYFPPHIWYSLPHSLKAYHGWTESSDLAELAMDIERIPKLVNTIHIDFLDPAEDAADGVVGALPIFTKLLEKRPHLLSLQIEGINVPHPVQNKNIRDEFTAAMETTFDRPCNLMRDALPCR